MAEPLGVLIVDDEPHARSGLRELLQQDGDVEVLGECGDGTSAVESILRLRPDIVLLDVQMPGMNGFEVLEAIGAERMPVVVFTTAYDRFALDAFEINAVDYLLKPFDDERFALALSRAKQGCRQSEVDDLSRRLVGLLEKTAAERGYPTRLVLKKSRRVFFVRTDTIDWIEAADYFVKLHAGGDVHVMREAMQSLEARLDPSMFFRVHRSAIVNLDRVKELQPYFHGAQIVVLHDGTELKLSRSRREKLDALLERRV